MLFWTCTRVGAEPEDVAPLPVRLAVWGLPLSLSATVKDALRAPLAVGENVTLIVQFDPAATEAPQLFVCP
jgi:hypothetical protein